MTDLLACPFCGEPPYGAPQEGHPKPGGGYHVSIWCDKCGGSSREETSDELAIAAWNRRTEPGKPESGVLAEVVKVRPLEWDVYPADGTRTFEGQNEQRQYLSRALPPIGPAIFIMIKDDVYSIEDREGIYGTENDAKLAAQADYEQRIMSALSTPPQPEQHLVRAYIHDLRVALAPFVEASRHYDKNGPLDMAHFAVRVCDLRIAKAVFDAQPPVQQAALSTPPQPEALQRRVEELEAALKPFANAIYNDNGDITVDLSVKSEDLVKAYFVLRRAALIQEQKDG
jgi:Lar family restriction alleviation protein